MTRVELVRYSMFGSTPIFKVGQDVVPGLRVPVVLPDASDRVFTVARQTMNRLDLISHLFYGTPELWWAITDVNAGLDPLDVPVGLQLRLPTPDRLAKEGVLV